MRERNDEQTRQHAGPEVTAAPDPSFYDGSW